MDSLTAVAMSAPPVVGVEGALDVGRGAIAGALIIGAAFLAGVAVFRRSPAALCGLLMVLAAAAIEFPAVGLVARPSPQILVLLQGVFAATAMIFLSTTIRAARNNAWLGGVMFAAALSLVGIGVINLLGRGDVSGLMRASLLGVGGFALLLAGSQVLKDQSARLIIPGVGAAIAAAFIASSSAGFSLLPHALFTFGVLAASLVALTDGASRRAVFVGPPAAAGSLNDETDRPAEAQDAWRISENQLAQVLDYSGVAVWDWSPDAAHQTDRLPALVGAPERTPLTPEAMRALVHDEDSARFDAQFLAPAGGDGAFDITVKLRDGRAVRLRGARAVDAGGAIERVVAFVEAAIDVRSRNLGTAHALSAAPGRAAHPLAAAASAALAKGEIKTVFQPIVTLETGVVAGYEALARWPGAPGAADRAPADELVRALQAAGDGRALASLVLREATAYVAEQMKALERRDLFVAINLSISQISDAGFSDEVRKLIAEHELPAKSLVLELTESDAITDTPAAEKVFQAMKTAGAALAFDDFGAGFSSLAHLSRFDFDYLKIDKSFIDDAHRENGGKVARAIAALGRDLGLLVIAEGVETRELAETAKKIGCTLGQGYTFGQPAPKATVPEPDRGKAKPAKKGLFAGGLR